MIVFDSVTKLVPSGRERKLAVSDATLVVPADRAVSVIGFSIADAVVFINLLTGQSVPSEGRVIRKCRVSFPAGHHRAFDPDLSVRENISHAARLYDEDLESTVEYVRQISELGAGFEAPFGALSAAEKRFVSELLACSLRFDTYVFATDVTRRKFRTAAEKRLLALITARARERGIIIPSGGLPGAPELFNFFVVLGKDGGVRLFEDFDGAKDAFNGLWSKNRKIA